MITNLWHPPIQVFRIEKLDPFTLAGAVSGKHAAGGQDQD
jgi:hypothetical protein